MNINPFTHVRSGRRVLAGSLVCLALAALGTGVPAADDPMAPVRLSAKDVDGGRVDVPEAGRTTVLLFLLAGQPQGPQAIAALSDAVGTAAGARVITVVGGSDAAVDVGRLRAAKHPWPIVLDAEHTLSGRMNVHAYPTTVIVSPDGLRVGHVAGLPKSYASNIEAYAAYAAGRIDRRELERRLASHDAVLDTPEQVAGRHVQVASRLLQKGLIEQSRGELARAVALNPKDQAVREALADLLLKAGDVAGATAMIDQLDGDTSAVRVKVLRARLLIATGHWDGARALLAPAVQLNPDPAEALYLLGLVYQHDEDWPKAADAFRRAFEHTPGGRSVAPAPATTAPGGQ